MSFKTIEIHNRSHSILSIIFSNHVDLALFGEGFEFLTNKSQFTDRASLEMYIYVYKKIIIPQNLQVQKHFPKATFQVFNYYMTSV